MLKLLRRVAFVAALIVCPAVAYAQAALTGTVKDASGAVLPGVTVEASSPALIEKTKAAVTNATGQYRIIDLRPGTYALSASLSGFTTVRRENIELQGSQTLTIPFELKVGGLQETITVTGETPVVDVQNARRELVMKSDVIETLPGARAAGALLNVTPGLQVGSTGLDLSPTMTFFNAHSSGNNSPTVGGEGRMSVNGAAVAAARSGGVSSYVYDTVNSEEVTVRVGGGLGESDIGGPVMNLVPKSGGNRFAGSAFLNEAGDWSRSNNLDAKLTAPPPGPNLQATPGIITSYDASVSYGGPVKRDRLWFYASYRNLDTQTAVEGIKANKYALDFSHWDWAPTETDARLLKDRQMMIGRLTAQFGKNRLQFNEEYQHRCEGTPLKVGSPGCHQRGDTWIGLGTTSQSPEASSTAGNGYFDVPYWLTQGSWNLPLTSKILLDASYTNFSYNPLFGFPAPDGDTSNIQVTEQSTSINPATGIQYAPRANYQYRSLASWGWAVGKTAGYNASMSYVTGSHSMKIGYQGDRQDQLDQTLTNSSLLAYRFNRGVPNAVSYRLPDFGHRTITMLNGVFAQDSWTRGRLTLQGALRWDRVNSFAPVDGNGTTATSFLNAATITFPKTEGVNAFNDLTPRIGVAYDVFGNGKTALKFNWGHYLGYASNDTPYISTNKAVTIPSSISNRSWTDNDTDHVVDCDLLNVGAQGPTTTGSVDTCGALSGNDINFGKLGSATVVDPGVLSGWGVRPNDYQSTITLQQEILPRISGDFSYTYRTFHGFFRTENLSRHAGGVVTGDSTQYFETYQLTTPVDSRLPGGGGYPVTVYTIRPEFGAVGASNYLTDEKSLGAGERDSHWSGFDITLNARLRGGLTTSIGSSTGRSVVNTCAQDIASSNPDPRGCNNVAPFQSTIRGLASYTIPKIDVLISGTFRSEPPLSLSASMVVPNSTIAAVLGHLPFGANPTGTTTIAITDEDHRIYANNRRSQIDMRFAKVLRFGRTRADVGVDLSNLLNTNYATAYAGTYSLTDANGGTWNNPTAVYPPRFVRLNFTFNF
ncbi:MAG TPA: TonB-dependent receptor [Vicinamibacterales bacterium]|nr:TonB-dependent receptor [Vicinamibacterales bacterium]